MKERLKESEKRGEFAKGSLELRCGEMQRNCGTITTMMTREKCDKCWCKGGRDRCSAARLGNWFSG